MNLGEKIKIYRIENKLTQKDLAEKVGVSRTNIAEIEGGRINGTVKFISKLSLVTDTPLSYWTDDMKSGTIKYNPYEALDVLIDSLIDTHIIGEDGKLNEFAQKLVINVLEKEIALKIKSKGDKK